MSFVKKVINKLSYEMNKLVWAYNRRAMAQCEAWQNVATIDETLDKLLSTDCSLCRFGDGEFNVMNGGRNGFQQKDAALAKRLRQILRSGSTPEILVCIPNVKGDMEIRTPGAKHFWTWYWDENGAKCVRRMNPQGKYYNAHVTRLYMDYQGCGKSEEWFSKIKGLWQDKNLLIVEGGKSRLGVGNDLFARAKSIKRILCPSQNAFSYYDDILEAVRRCWSGELVLIALGQTATVLAYDLSRAGIRALDIGHIDIEYEWFLSGTDEKVPVAGKFVKEVQDQNDDALENPEYLSQIISRVGV